MTFTASMPPSRFLSDVEPMIRDATPRNTFNKDPNDHNLRAIGTHSFFCDLLNLRWTLNRNSGSVYDDLLVNNRIGCIQGLCCKSRKSFRLAAFGIGTPTSHRDGVTCHDRAGIMPLGHPQATMEVEWRFWTSLCGSQYF